MTGKRPIDSTISKKLRPLADFLSRRIKELRYVIFQNLIPKWKELYPYYASQDGNILIAFLNTIVALRNYNNTSVYRNKTGGYPNYIRPVSFTEKIQHRKIFDRNPLFPIFCDKLAARQYASERCPDIRLPELYWVGDDPDAIPFDALEPPYIIKPNNRSHRIYRVESAADIDQAKIRRLCGEWLAAPPHGQYKREWAYEPVEGRILIEEHLKGSENSPSPPDYKFHVFDGKVMFIVYVLKSEEVSVTYFDTNWTRLPYAIADKGRGEPRIHPTLSHVPQPKRLDDMNCFAHRLAEGLGHLRVDLYNLDGEIFFGELTPYDHAGFKVIFRHPASLDPQPPRDLDIEIGQAWTLPHIGWPLIVLRGLFG